MSWQAGGMIVGAVAVVCFAASLVQAGMRTRA